MKKIKEFELNGLQVYPKDAPSQMDWNDAIFYCKRLGADWRLPNRSELEEMYKNRNKIGGFSDDFYWSNYEDPKESTHAWGMFFSNGARYDYHKSYLGSVRAVKGEFHFDLYEEKEKMADVKKIIEIKEDTKIGNIILEKGDKIKVLKEMDFPPRRVFVSRKDTHILELFTNSNFPIDGIEVYQKNGDVTIIFDSEDEIV